jgi:uncharacterized protein DUF4159
MTRRVLFLVSALVAAIVSAASAQIWTGGTMWRGWRGEPPRLATRVLRDGQFHFCRLGYSSWYREDGGQGWRTDYPGADINFSIRFGELTKSAVSRDEDGEPEFFVVRADEDALFACPFVHMEDAGTAELSDTEARRLREYLLKGGFIWNDDFWGPDAWQNWKRQISRVLPSQYAIVDIPVTHPMFQTLFHVKRILQVPSIQRWRGLGGDTSERGADSAVVNTRAILDGKGRVMVLMTHNTDLSDTWEREGEDAEYFYRFSPEGYAIAINVMLYQMTH